MKEVANFCLVLVGLVLLLGCESKQRDDADLSDFVPDTASLTFKINSLEQFREDIRENTLLAEFQDTELFTLLHSDKSILQFVTTTNPGVLSVIKRNDSVLDYLFATKLDSTVFQLDSIADKSIETLSYKNISLDRVTLGGRSGFTAVKDSIFIASSSQKVVEAMITSDKSASANFKKAFSAIKNNALTAVTNTPTYVLPNGERHRLGSHAAFEVMLDPNGVSASGVVLVRDTVPQLLAVFKGQIPQQNDLESVIPTSATDAISVTLSDASLFFDNLGIYNNQPIEAPSLGLFGSINEVGEIQLPEGNAVVLKSIDPELTAQALAPFLSESSSFRETTLFLYDEGPSFYDHLTPFITTESVGVHFQLDNFFVFSENTAVAETIISAFKNGTTVAKSSSFDQASNGISNASSLLQYGINKGTGVPLQNILQSNHMTVFPVRTLTKFPLALLQFSFDRDFAHMHFMCFEGNSKQQVSEGVSEVFNKTFETALLGTPYFFNDHRSGKKNVVVQDISNTVHLLSGSGKTLWTRTLKDAILGEIQEIDLLRNGKKQLVFTTGEALYVIDRNGKDVGPFPITFKDPITQPLAVFDYDNNRKYRFAVVQDKEISLYDSAGKIVNGFTFKKANSTIVLPPTHIRMGNKDYVVIAEENGSLNILSRTGKVRVPVQEKFNFSENPIQREGNSFVVVTKEKEKKSIATNGTVSSKTLGVSSSYHFATLGNVKVTMDDNLLRINGKLVELPFGIYTMPRVFSVNRNTYITVTEIQENKVFVYSRDGSLLPNFPIFGTSSASLSSEKRKNLLLVTTGDKELAVYSF